MYSISYPGSEIKLKGVHGCKFIRSWPSANQGPQGIIEQWVNPLSFLDLLAKGIKRGNAVEIFQMDAVHGLEHGSGDQANEI